MTVEFENETDADLGFDMKSVIESVAQAVLETENCPYEAQINVLLTDDEGIRHYNLEFRDMDRPTDVLSFPGLEFSRPGDYSRAEEAVSDCFDPDTGGLLLGDIILSADRIREQAAAYGHSEKRELAFLTAHSMLHLSGYDHMEEKDAAAMEEKQEAILKRLGIGRE